MKTAAIISFALFGMTALSVPLIPAKRQATTVSNSTATTYTNTTVPAATATTRPVLATIYPEIQMQFDLATPAAFGVDSKQVEISSTGSKNKVVAYNFPIQPEHNGKMCRFEFRIDSLGHISSETQAQRLIDIWHRKQNCINTKNSYNDIKDSEKVFLGSIKATSDSIDRPSAWEMPFQKVDEDPLSISPLTGYYADAFPCNNQELVIELSTHSANSKISWTTTEKNLNGLTIVAF